MPAAELQWINLKLICLTQYPETVSYAEVGYGQSV